MGEGGRCLGNGCGESEKCYLSFLQGRGEGKGEATKGPVRAEGEPKANRGKEKPLAPPAVWGISNAPRGFQKRPVRQFLATEGNGEKKARKRHKTREGTARGGGSPAPFSRCGRKSRRSMCLISNAPRTSRAPPPTRAGGKRRREEKVVFLTHVFYKTDGQSGGRTKKATPRPAPSRTRGKRTPRRSAARFRRRPRSHSHPFNRNRTSGARSRGVTAVWRPRVRHREVKKSGFSKGAFHLLLGRRARDATNAPF